MTMLAELRDEIADIMDIAPKDVHEGPMRRLINRTLIDTQARLYRQYEFDALKRWFELDVIAGVNLYPYPNAVNNWTANANYVINQVIKDTNGNYQSAGQTGTAGAVAPVWNVAVGGETTDNGVTWVNLGSSAPPQPEPRRFFDVRLIYNVQWLPMVEGIPPASYTLTGTMFPRLYAHRQGQIEVWPSPDAAYVIMIYAYQQLNAFAADTDTLTLDRDLIYAATVATLKASPRFKHPDAGEYAALAQTHLRALIKENIGNKRFVPGRDTTHEVIPMPILKNPE